VGHREEEQGLGVHRRLPVHPDKRPTDLQDLLVVALLLLDHELLVVVLHVLQSADQGLLGQVQVQLVPDLLSQVVYACVGRHLQHSLYRLVEHLRLLVDVLVLEPVLGTTLGCSFAVEVVADAA
jgi:hypothetical protein